MLGLIAIVINVLGDPELGIRLIPPGVLAFGPKIAPGPRRRSNLLAVVMFALLGVLALPLRAQEAGLEGVSACWSVRLQPDSWRVRLKADTTGSAQPVHPLR